MAVKATELATPKRRAVLPTGRCHPPRPIAKAYDGPDTLRAALQSALLVALDVETRGRDYSLPVRSLDTTSEDDPHTSEVVGIGLAWGSGSVYIPYSTLSEEHKASVMDVLVSSTAQFIAHNLYFDGGWIAREVRRLLPGGPNQLPGWYMCTYAALAYTQNEGYPDDSWSLKSAMVEFLGWEQTNETEKDNWLIYNGFTKQHGGPDQSHMWRIPHGILGEYCRLDAEATYLLWTRVLRPVVFTFPGLRWYLESLFLRHILVHIEQKFLGVRVDLSKLRDNIDTLLKELSDAEAEFRGLPGVAEAIAKAEQELVNPLREDLVAAGVKKYNKCSIRSGTLGDPAINKDGSVSKVWLAKKARFESHDCELTCVSQSYISLQEKVRKAELGLLPDYRFSMTSPDDKARLLYDSDKLALPVMLRTDKTGAPSTSSAALAMAGPVGRALINYSEKFKELGFYQSYIKKLEMRNTLHPSFRMPGAKTGRLSSAEPNFQQIPKSKRMMGMFIAPEGYSFVDVDFAALESVTAAELSGDKNLRFLYEDPARPNDIHLFVGSQVPGEMGAAIRATGYDPYSPTPETIAAGKKGAKYWRSIAKTAVYLLQYGGGVDTLLENLVLAGVSINRDQVETIVHTYHDTFSGVKEYSRHLEREARRNGFFVKNGFGLPMCVFDAHGKYRVGTMKDVFSRVNQSTGHIILVYYCCLLYNKLEEKIPDWVPVLWDLHDATTIAVPDSEVEHAKWIMAECLKELNDDLRGELPLSGVPTSGKTLADVKEPED